MSIEVVKRRPKGSRATVSLYRVRIRTKLDHGEVYLYDKTWPTLTDAKNDQERMWGAIKGGKILKEIKESVQQAREPSFADLLKAHSEATWTRRALSGREIEKGRLCTTIPNVFVHLGRFPDKEIFKQNPQSVETSRGHVFRVGDIRMTKCTADVIRAWMQTRGTQIGEDTLRRELNLISAAFQKAAILYPDYPVENPVVKLTKDERPRQSGHRERVLSESEEKILFSVLDRSRSDVGDVVRVALGTAMRQSEILRMDWNRVDMESRTIRIDEDKTSRLGWRFVSRTVGMFPLAYDTLLKRWGKAKKPDHGSIFTYTSEGFKASWKRLIKKADIKQLTFHDLRHTAITRAAASGLSVLQTAAAFGIQDPEHLQKRVFDKFDAENAAHKTANNETLSSREIASVGGHRGLRTTIKYANLTASDVVTQAVQQGASGESRIRFKKENGIFVASVNTPDGIVEAEGSTPAEAQEMIKSLTAPTAA